MVEKNRYSDSELEVFKSVINSKLEQARMSYELLTNKDGNNGVDDTSPTFKGYKEGATVETQRINAQLAERQRKFIIQLEAVLIRIENKTYGICQETGKLIPKERLMAVPHATLCIEVKQTAHA